jgi:hypothetical protein
LEKKGFLKRVQDPRDRRVIRVHLSEEAKEMVSSICDSKDRIMASIFSRMGDDGMELLKRAIGTFLLIAFENENIREIACQSCGEKHSEECLQATAL